MPYKKSLPSLLSGLKRTPAIYLIMPLIAIPALALLLYATYFITPKTVSYNFEQNSACIAQPTLLPQAVHYTGSEHNATLTPAISIGNFPLLSNKTCITYTQAPQSNTKQTLNIRLKHFGIIRQPIELQTAELPKLAIDIKPNTLTSTKEELILPLSEPDKTFTYQVATKESATACKNEQTQIACSLSPLNLVQAKSYDLRFERIFNGNVVETLHTTTIKTVEPVEITGSSIAPNATIYDNPSSITLNTNKVVTEYNNIQVKSGDKTLVTETRIDGTKLIISFASPLERKANYSVSIDGLTAEDKGYLDKPFSLSFTTSDGPIATGTTIPSYGVDPGSSIILNFDYPLLNSQDISKYVVIRIGASSVPYRANINNKSLTLTLTQDLPRCTAFTIEISPGIQNIHGVPSSQTWKYASRTICQEVFSIGTSAQGRPITAYKFGGGSSVIVYVGATHGDEIGSKYLMDSWVNELEANYPMIPGNRSIVVIPSLNPDAVAAGTRVNANNVDLNRNFPANNWKSDVIMPGGQLLVKGGGATALSEPESKTIASYITAQKPRLVLTFHSKGSLVVANEAGDSVGIAQAYGAASGYYATSESRLGTTFAYDTTGAMENWLYDKLQIPTLLIELKTHDQNEFSRNKTALWQTVKL